MRRFSQMLLVIHNRIITILWDKTGKKFGKGKGLFVFADGKQIAHTDSLDNIKVN